MKIKPKHAKVFKKAFELLLKYQNEKFNEDYNKLEKQYKEETRLHVTGSINGQIFNEIHFVKAYK